MNTQPLLITMLVVALVSGAAGWVGGWLVRGYRTEIARMGR